jgi:hypothetical protein
MPKTARTMIPALLIAIASFSLPAIADDDAEKGIEMAAGRWIFDVQIQLPMQTEPASQKLQTCVTDEPITAETLMPWAESQGCKIRSVKAIENGLKWKLRCSVNGQKSRGNGEFTVEGDRGEGKARVNFEMGGRRMAVITKWEAIRLGECSTASGADQASPETSDDTD